MVQAAAVAYQARCTQVLLIKVPLVHRDIKTRNIAAERIATLARVPTACVVRTFPSADDYLREISLATRIYGWRPHVKAR